RVLPGAVGCEAGSPAREGGNPPPLDGGGSQPTAESPATYSACCCLAAAASTSCRRCLRPHGVNHHKRDQSCIRHIPRLPGRQRCSLHIDRTREPNRTVSNTSS